ncbi:MAG TPA: hypothetical protein VJQ45_01055 [Ktedonobacterales bacterium]|nr:hypothetical protein [Ktedonobacterales bacterium]
MQGYNDEARLMATAMIYDTLKLAEQLEHEAGFDASRARAMARILAENAGGNLVTREDLLIAKRELESAIQGVRSDLQATVVALDGKVGALQSDVRVLYWISGTTLAGVTALLGTAITIALHLMRLG